MCLLLYNPLSLENIVLPPKMQKLENIPISIQGLNMCRHGTYCSTSKSSSLLLPCFKAYIYSLSMKGNVVPLLLQVRGIAPSFSRLSVHDYVAYPHVIRNVKNKYNMDLYVAFVHHYSNSYVAISFGSYLHT